MTPTAITTTPASSIDQRVQELRLRDAIVSRDEAWAWFDELGREAARDRAAAASKLGELFRLGVPPAGLDGEAEGAFVTTLIAAPVDRAARRLASVWMPWLGKRFDGAAGRGENLLALGARRTAAFAFKTGVEPGKLDSDVRVLKLDYAPIPIRDELVEIVPGASLGKILWRSRGGSHRLIGYFALRS